MVKAGWRALLPPERGANNLTLWSVEATKLMA
jgi:hypothetical protein